MVEPPLETIASCDRGDRRDLREVPAKGDHRDQRSRGRARAGRSGARVPVLGSGHPLADVFLLKHTPRPSELQEGVAFYGRSGTRCSSRCSGCASTRSPIYGTNCLKFGDGDEDESRAFLSRELHIVQPKLVVVMGEPAREFLNSVFPLSRELGRRRESCRSSRRRSRDSSRPTSTSRSTSSRRRRRSGTPSRCSASGGAETTSVLESAAVLAFIAVALAVGTWFPPRRASRRWLWPTVAIVSAGVMPGTFLSSSRAAALADSLDSAVVAALVLGLVAFLRRGADPPSRELHEARADDASRAGRFSTSSSISLGRPDCARSSPSSTHSRSSRRTPTHEIVNDHPMCYPALAVAFLVPGGGPRASARPTSSSSPSSSRLRSAGGSGRLDVAGDDRDVLLTLVLANAADVNGLPALPFLSAGFLLANADLLWKLPQAASVLVLTLEQRDALDVRCVREHVDRRHAPSS